MFGESGVLGYRGRLFGPGLHGMGIGWLQDGWVGEVLVCRGGWRL